ncbi:hypothetical protein ACM66B_006213 [Microbotryomycetes sp. NB124-2]
MAVRTPPTRTLSSLVSMLSQQHASASATPNSRLAAACLPCIINDLPPPLAQSTLFTSQGTFDLPKIHNMTANSSSSPPLVSIEHTTRDSFTVLDNVPLTDYLSYLNAPPREAIHSMSEEEEEGTANRQSLYLAQLPPPRIFSHLFVPSTSSSSSSSSYPQPSLPFTDSRTVAKSSTSCSAEWLRHSTTRTSIWLGLTPTTTTWHRDPDHNILYQIKGRKRVKLTGPERGQRMYDRLRRQRSKPTGKGIGTSARIRGQEMLMPGKDGERDELEKLVWIDSGSDESLSKRGFEADGHEIMWQADIDEGQALYIPLGWWHAVRGRTTRPDGLQELSASVNWWFRPRQR